MHIGNQREDALLLPFAVQLANELFDSIDLIVQRPERKIAHSLKEDVGTVETLAQDFPNPYSFVCAICKREPSLLFNDVANVNPI